jgi:hypothetical protein
VRFSSLTLSIVLDVPERALGTVAFVRVGAAALYVYSNAGSADQAVLDRSANYLGTELDVWCWYTKPPVSRIGIQSPITGSWQLQEGLESDFERHEFRVPEAYWEIMHIYSLETQALIRQLENLPSESLPA